MMSGAARKARWICAGFVIAVAAPAHAAPAGEPAAWCPALRDVAALVRARDRFASIIGRPREGNYFETTLPLTGWGDCSLYGRRTYVCDSQPLETADAAAGAFAKTVDDVKGCLRDGWTEDPNSASPGYAVIRDDRQVASITINMDRTDKNDHVVRLILFLRSR
jgi:hypothetical protein